MIRILILLCTILMLGCTKDNGITNPTPNIKKSEVQVFCHNKILDTKANTLYDKTNEIGYSIPKDGMYDVWYYIRIDGNIPNEPTFNLANQYFPQTTTGKTVIDDLNHGLIKADANWSMSVTKKFPLYLYDGNGSEIQDIIVTEPTLDDLINANQSTKYDLKWYAEHKDELHFIWYACKQQSTDHIWHIDGILTTTDRTDISQTIYGSNVEVDIHQQEHNTWNEIKTSIHLRDTVDVEILIPIESAYICKADDFDVRLANLYEYVEDFKPSLIIDGIKYELYTRIDHKSDGIHITVKPNKEALVAARKEYDDGITFEIHTFVSQSITNKDIWDKLKKSTCKTIPTTNILNGQVTSAYFDEKIKF